MPTSEPPIPTTPLPDGTRYDLPLRPLGVYRLLALLPLGFGIALAVGPAAGLIRFLMKFTQNASPWAWLILLVFIPFLLGAYRIIMFGLRVLFGRNAVELTGDTVRRVEAVGPLQRTSRQPLDGITGIEVQSAKNITGGIVDLAALTAKRGDKDERPFIIAWGYPTATLQQLGNAITERIEADRGASRPTSETPPAPITPLRVNAPTLNQITQPDVPDEEAPPLPDDSTALMDERPDGVAITLPPIGLRKGGKGLFGFSIFWCGFMAVFTGIAVVGGGLAPSKTGGVWPTLGLSAFIALFWAVGITMALIAINAGRRRGIIDVVGQGPDATLLITYKGLFRQKQHEWPARELQAVKVAPSGVQVNDEDLYNLHIIPRAGKTAKLFTERADEELHWLAGYLRQRLGCGSEAVATPDQDHDTALRQPPNSTVYLDRHANGLTFALPAIGIWKAGKAILGFALIWNLFLTAFVVVLLKSGPIGWMLLFPFAILGILFLAGLGMLLYGINLGRRIGLIDLTHNADGRKLTVTTKGLFGKRVASWPTAEVKRIHVGPSGTQVNGRDILNLRITTADGEEHGYFGEREDADLHWIAATLRQELSLYPDGQPDIA